MHVPVRSLLAIVEVLEGAIRKRCGRLHTLKTMCALECTAGNVPHPPGRLRCQIAGKLAERIRWVEFAAPTCGSRQRLVRDERVAQPFTTLGLEGKMPNFGAGAFNEMVESMR